MFSIDGGGKEINMDGNAIALAIALPGFILFAIGLAVFICSLGDRKGPPQFTASLREAG
jgi:hypothetical protein